MEIVVEIRWAPSRVTRAPKKLVTMNFFFEQVAIVERVYYIICCMLVYQWNKRRGKSMMRGGWREKKD